MYLTGISSWWVTHRWILDSKDAKERIDWLIDHAENLEKENIELRRKLSFFDEYFSDEIHEVKNKFTTLEKENAELRDSKARLLDLAKDFDDDIGSLQKENAGERKLYAKCIADDDDTIKELEEENARMKAEIEKCRESGYYGRGTT